MWSAQKDDANNGVDNCTVSRKLFVGNTQSLLDYQATQTVADDKNRLVRGLAKV